MAPAYEIGHAQKSLVRIPGSGVNKCLKPVCLEIAQITSFQMTDVIPEFQLPPPELNELITNTSFNIFEPRSPPTLASSEESENSETRVWTRPMEGNGPEPPNRKSDNVESDNLDSEIFINPRTRKIRILLDVRYELKKENVELLTKLTKFKELIKDRVKLNEFLCAMKELKC